MPNISTAVSFVILCHNEAANLPRCIAAAQACGDVVVLDDGSEDGSREIAKQCGARVVTHPFKSFADQRNWAIEHAGLQCDWVLHLDADEVLPPDLATEIRTRLPALTARHVGYVARKFMLDETWLRHSTEYPVYVPRLVHRMGPRFTMRGHGDVIAGSDYEAVYLNGPLIHYAFSKGLDEWRARHVAYAAAEARRIRNGEIRFSIRDCLSSDPIRRRRAWRMLSYRVPGRPCLRFLYAYVGRRGFLDGRAGLTYCRALAWYEALIDRKLNARETAGK